MVELPESNRALHNKQVKRLKEEHDGTKRYKARLFVKEFQQREDIDFNEIFSPVVKLNIISSVLNIVMEENLHLKQLDVKTVFLYERLSLIIHSKLPLDFVFHRQSLITLNR